MRPAAASVMGGSGLELSPEMMKYTVAPTIAASAQPMPTRLTCAPPKTLMSSIRPAAAMSAPMAVSLLGLCPCRTQRYSTTATGARYSMSIAMPTSRVWTAKK